MTDTPSPLKIKTAPVYDDGGRVGASTSLPRGVGLGDFVPEE
jgi:hypothetical protein